MCGTTHLHLARGPFTTNDRAVQKFLANYPGVTVWRVAKIEAPAPIQPGQYGHAGDSPTVINGGFSGGGAAAQKSQKPMSSK